MLPTQTTHWIATQESEGACRGQTSMSASGDKIANVGAMNIKGFSNSRALCSVAKLCDTGEHPPFLFNRWVFLKTEAASVQNIIFGYSRQCWEPPFEFSWAGQLRDQSSRSMLVKPERRLTEHGGGEEKVLWAGGDDERRHVEGGEVSHGEDEPAETFDPLRRRHLKQPTPEEVRVHQTTHLPVRERRAECWGGAAHDHVHRSDTVGEESEVLGTSRSTVELLLSNGCRASAVVFDKETKYASAHVGTKELSRCRFCSKLSLFRLGSSWWRGPEVKPRTTSTKEFLKKIHNFQTSMRTIREQCLVGGSRGNGVAERGIQSTEK